MDERKRAVVLRWLLMFLGGLSVFAAQAGSVDFENYFSGKKWALSQTNPATVIAELQKNFTTQEDWSTQPLDQSVTYLHALFHHGEYLAFENAEAYVVRRCLREADSTALIPLLRIVAANQKVRIRFEQSRNLLQAILQFYQKPRNPVGEAETYIDLAELCRAENRYDEGLAYIAKAHQIHRSAGIPLRMLARMYGREAALHNEGAKDYQKGKQASLRALEQAEKLGDRALIASCCNEMGLTYQKLYDYEAAMNYYRRAEALWEVLNHQRYLARAHLNMASLHNKLGDKQACISLTTSVLARSKQYDWKSLEGFAARLLMRVHANAENPELFAEYLDQSIEASVDQERARFQQALDEANTQHKAAAQQLEKRIEAMEQEAALTEKAVPRYKIIIGVLVAVLLLLLVILLKATQRKKERPQVIIDLNPTKKVVPERS
ncbi:MAG: tetratricopeptide repeat protein [Salibacteraceae bacterium]